MTDLELKEKLAYIDLMIMQKRTLPWVAIAGLITAAATLLAAGVAAGVGLAKLWGGR